MKANRLSFSIVICTLNNISALKKCIESIINQTLKANEVIVVHGGDRSSTLKYIEVINKLNNTNYIYLKKQNRNHLPKIRIGEMNLNWIKICSKK